MIFCSIKKINLRGYKCIIKSLLNYLFKNTIYHKKKLKYYYTGHTMVNIL